jgi:PAS domain S-box-containing protein
MSIDIHTLVAVLGVTHLIQAVVFVYQYRFNRVYRGIGWWLAWSMAEIAGFVFILLRDIPSIHPAAVFAQNTMIVLGTLFLYIGVMHFLDRKENRRFLFILFAVYMAALAWFLFVRDDYNARGVIISLALAAVSFFTAWSLLVNRMPSIAASAAFNSALFIVHGCIFGCRAVMILAGEPTGLFFAATPFNMFPFIDALVVGLLWTFGLVIMVNQRLAAELAEAKEHFEEIFDTSPDGALITSADDGEIAEVNRAFFGLMGYTNTESVGKTSLDIRLWKNTEDRRRFVRALDEKGMVENFETVFVRKDGSERFGLVSAKKITLHGKPHIISVTRDITERRKAEEELKLLLKEKEVLVREVHHRVKNNFAVVTSLLNLQSRQIEDQRIRDVLDKSRDRIRSMSLIHERLYQSKSLTHINLSEYIRSLANDLHRSYGPETSNVTLSVKTDDVAVKLDQAIPCGLVLNELISNALKYAFPHGFKGKGLIEVTLSRKAGNKVELSVKDNGVGLPENFGEKKAESMGMKIVTMLAEDQIGGTLDIVRKKGTEFVVRFRLSD